MQSSVPKLADFDSEPESALQMYGLGENEPGQDSAEDYLLARRPVYICLALITGV
ncbi:MAG: hypothetical protein AAF664_05230 [Planctomycetota bacterium]